MQIYALFARLLLIHSNCQLHILVFWRKLVHRELTKRPLLPYKWCGLWLQPEPFFNRNRPLKQLRGHFCSLGLSEYLSIHQIRFIIISNAKEKNDELISAYSLTLIRQRHPVVPPSSHQNTDDRMYFRLDAIRNRVTYLSLLDFGSY